jgi:hypothetical protein
MAQTLKCPNCKAPVEPDPKKPTVACAYCGYHLKNTLYAPPKPKTPPHQRQPIQRYMWLFYVVPIVLAALGAIPAIIMGTCVRSTKFSVSVNTPTTTGASPRPTRASRTRAATKAEKKDPQREREAVLTAYIDCLDGTYWRVVQSDKRYRSWRKRNPERAPTCKERYIMYGLYEVGGADRCNRKLEKIGTPPPDLAGVHQSVTRYAAALAELGPLTKELDSYYDKKAFLLDDCGKARAKHPLLMAAFEKTRAARDALLEALSVKVKGTLARCIARTEKLPEHRGTLLWARMIQVAGDTVTALRTQWKAAKPDLQQIKAALARFNEAVAPLETLDNEQKRRSGADWAGRGANEFSAAGIAFLKSRAGRRLGSSARFWISRGSDRHGIDGTFEKVLKEYNDLLEEAHHMKHCGRLPRCDDDRCPEPR